MSKVYQTRFQTKTAQKPYPMGRHTPIMASKGEYPGEESWKYDAQQRIFDEFRGVWSGDETLCRTLDITSQAKWF